MPAPPLPVINSADNVRRRVMFALELADPITRRLVGKEMTVTAPGYAPPLQSPSGRYVWLDINPPAQRTIKLQAVSKHGVFGTLDEEFDVPPHLPNMPASALLKRFELTPTGLYEPPVGMIAAAGMLIDSASSRAPVAGAAVRIQLRRQSDSNILTSDYAGRTDSRGGFVAVMPDLGDQRPLAVPAPAPEGGIVGWLRFDWPGGPIRFSELQDFRNGRQLRVPAPLVWDELRSSVPPAPP
jgi:hypothetical protein